MKTVRGVVRPFVVLYPRVVRLVAAANGWRLALALGLALIGGLGMPLQIWISKLVIDEIAAMMARNAPLEAFAGLIPALAGFITVWVVSQACHSFGIALGEIMSERTEYATALACIRKANTFDLSFFDSGAQSSRLEQVTQQRWRLQSSVTMMLGVSGQAISLMSLIGILISINWLIPLVLCLAVLPRVIVRSYFAHRLYAHYTNNVESQMLSWHLNTLLTRKRAAKEVRIFGIADYLTRQYGQHREIHLQSTQKIVLTRERGMLAVNLLSALGTIAAWALAAVQAAGRAISAGGLAAAFQSIQQAGNVFDGIFEQLGYLYSNAPFLDEIFAFLDTTPESIPSALAKPSGAQAHSVPRPIRTGIVFDNVSFRYPESDQMILENVSFALRPGESLAVVGENGAGKSTVAKLLLRLYDPTSGSITLDGMALPEYDKHAYHAQVAAVFQDYMEFNLSARENIGFGNVDAMRDDTRIATAAAQAGAGELIAGLPEGLDSMLGKTIERGVDLSGGQWQRLALARAFMRDAQVLVMDEPSAALDPLAERDMYQRFAELTAGKVTVLISHRLASCKIASRIIVLEHGRIIEEGTHDALMAKNGRYAEMFNAQAEHYQQQQG